MKRLKYIVVILFFKIFILFCIPTGASQISLGGQFNTSLSTLYSKPGGLIFLPQANLDLELFLPFRGNNEIRCAGYLFTDTVEGKLGFFWKKLYWKYRTEDFHLSIGKQPVSWSFGSLLNPVDYTLGAVALDRDYNPKYQNALELFIPINWNTSLSAVTSLLEPDLTWKVGLRGRTLIKGFDITINCIQERLRTGEAGEFRSGMTAKGDLGPFGVYSALGYYSERERDAYSLLAGFDYSYFFPAGSQLYVQAEYLNIPPDIVPKVTGLIFTSPKKEGNTHLFAKNIIYKIDEFSSIGLTALYNSSTGTAVFMPSYSNQLSTNTTFKLLAGWQSKLFSPTENSSHYPDSNQPAYSFLEVGITYAF